MLPHARRVAKVSLVAHCNCNADWCLNSNGMPDSRLQDDFLGTSPTSSTTSSLSSSSLTNRGRHHGHAADRRHTAGPSASLAPGRDIPHKKRARTLGVAGQDWAAGFAGTPVSPFSLDHKRPSRPSSREDEFKYLTS